MPKEGLFADLQNQDELFQYIRALNLLGLKKLLESEIPDPSKLRHSVSIVDKDRNSPICVVAGLSNPHDPNDPNAVAAYKNYQDKKFQIFQCLVQYKFNFSQPNERGFLPCTIAYAARNNEIHNEWLKLFKEKLFYAITKCETKDNKKYQSAKERVSKLLAFIKQYQETNPDLKMEILHAHYNGDAQDNLLHTAVSINKPEILQLLLESGMDMGDMRHRNKDGYTPFLLAVKLGYVDCVRFFLETNLEFANSLFDMSEVRTSPLVEVINLRVSPLYLALNVYNADGLYPDRQKSIVELLLEHGAHSEVGRVDPNNHQNTETPLEYVVRREKIELLKLLIKNNVDLTRKYGKDEKTILQLARENKKDAVAPILEEAIKKLDNPDDIRIQLLFNIASPNLVMVKRILKRYQEQFEKNIHSISLSDFLNQSFVHNGRATTFVEYVVLSDNSDMLELLRQHGTSLDKVYTEQSYSLIWLSAAKGCVQSLTFLLEYSLLLDNIPESKISPLEIAAQNNYLKCVVQICKHLKDKLVEEGIINPAQCLYHLVVQVLATMPMELKREDEAYKRYFRIMQEVLYPLLQHLRTFQDKKDGTLIQNCHEWFWILRNAVPQTHEKTGVLRRQNVPTGLCKMVLDFQASNPAFQIQITTNGSYQQ